MPKRGVRHIKVTHVDFDSLLGKSPQEIYGLFVGTCRMNRKRLLPASLQWNNYRVSETPNLITIHLALNEDDVAYFSFARPPRFT